MIRTVMTGACALALGVAWAIAPAGADDMKTKAERAGDKIETKAERAKDTLERKTDRAEDKIDAAGDKISAKARRAKDKLEAQADRAHVKQVQQALKDKGHDPGPVDGVMGPRTRSAVQDFQKAQGLMASGRVDEATMAKLDIRASEQRGTSPSASPRTGSPTERRQNP